MTTRPTARWVLRTLLTLMIAAAGCLFAAGTAQAGGPTSALLVSPSTGQAAAVYYSDAEYEQLNTLLGDYEPAAGPTATPTSRAGGEYVTVTWLIHDVSVWRIDRIFIGAADGPWIVTQMVHGEATSGMYPGEAGDGTAITHRSPDPAALQDLLTSFGLVGPVAGRAGGEAAAFEAAPIAAPVATADAAGIQAVPVDVRAGSSWWWALAGLAVGVLLTAMAVRFLPAVRTRLSEPTTADQPAVDGDGLVRMTPMSR